MLQAARCLVIGFIPLLVHSQATNNSITVTATQTTSAQPDQAIFGIVVNSGFDKNLSDIVGAVQSAGITAANFVGFGPGQFVLVNPFPPPGVQPQLQWNFRLIVPISKVKDTTASLAALAQSIPQNKSGLSLTFSVQGTEVSSPQPSPCSFSDLLTNARTQAGQLATAAASTVGLIQAISSATPAPCYLATRFGLGTVAMPSQPYSITVTASRPLAVQPDEVSLQLTVTSNTNAGLDDITTAMQQAGISGATFAGVYTSTFYTGNGTQSTPQSQLQWSFSLTAPLAKIKDTFTALVAAQQSLAKATPPFGFSFYGAGTLISPQRQQSLTCPDTDLVNDAQTAAQKIAAAAGVSLGPILGVSGGNTPVLGAPPGYRLGDFSGATFTTVLGGVITTAAPAVQQSCSMTVTFVLVQ